LTLFIWVMDFSNFSSTFNFSSSLNLIHMS
jgi:hypothetical protein